VFSLSSFLSLSVSLSSFTAFAGSLSTHEARKLFFKVFYNVPSYKCTKGSRWEPRASRQIADIYVTSRLRNSLAEMKIDAFIIIRIFSSIVDIHFFLFASDISRVNYARAEVRSLTSNALALDKFDLQDRLSLENMKIIPGRYKNISRDLCLISGSRKKLRLF